MQDKAPDKAQVLDLVDPVEKDSKTASGCANNGMSGVDRSNGDASVPTETAHGTTVDMVREA